MGFDMDDIDMDMDMDWNSQEIMYLAFGIFGGIIVFFSICCACCNRKRRQTKAVISIQSNRSSRSTVPNRRVASTDDGNVHMPRQIHTITSDFLLKNISNFDM